VEFNAIIKIRKYGGLHEGHHFIPMAMEVHDAPRCDMDHFIRECAHFFPQYDAAPSYLLDPKRVQLC